MANDLDNQGLVVYASVRLRSNVLKHSGAVTHSLALLHSSLALFDNRGCVGPGPSWRVSANPISDHSQSFPTTFSSTSVLFW
jgi:hypothetical protein